MSTNDAYQYFEKSAEQFPQREALHVSGSSYTYTELRQFVANLEYQLSVETAPVIGLFARKNLTAYAGLLAILKSGRAYAPLNPKFPATRNRQIIQAAGIETIIAGHDHRSELELFLESSPSSLLVIMPETGRSDQELRNQFPGHRFIFRDEFSDPTDLQKSRKNHSDGIAYILFTSGSTGTPKAVPVRHRNLISYIDHINELNNFREDDKFSQTFDLTFDPSVQDMFSAWSNGAALYDLPDQFNFLPAKFIQENRLTVWHSVPSIARLMMLYKTLKKNQFPSLRYSFFGGEPLHGEVVKSWLKAAPDSIIDNLYGPTEVTITISQYRIYPHRKPSIKTHNGIVSVGKIYSHHNYLLLDDDEHISTREGELLISGPQVVDGYMNNDEATNQQFVTFPEIPGMVWYRTGDYMKADDTGNLYFISRTDHQIKIRGNRVEIGEINHTVESLTGPQTAQTLPIQGKNGSVESLVLFLLNSVQQDDSAILKYVSSRLPSYMVPQKIIRTDTFPLSENGKIDHQKLKNLYLNGHQKHRQPH
jgi:amino acid adenylation domain-containing protein